MRAAGDKEVGSYDERRDRWLAAVVTLPKVDKMIAQKAMPVRMPTRELRKPKGKKTLSGSDSGFCHCHFTTWSHLHVQPVLQ
jgi:hypothetical protein